ncbi:MAG TPA: alpha/beta fold hydrolase [Vicinamibacterales bacterium]|nr:alpha/beta fold hydrolase [Vicinamibacterales bacterium]
MATVGRFRYLEAAPRPGARPRGAVVLLHAFPLNARMWGFQFEPLAADGWRVVAPQMRGVDDDGAGDPPTSGIDDYAADVVDMLDALHVEEAVIGGCSMGGYLALALMRLAPNYFRGLLLVDTRPQADAPEALEGRRKLLRTAEEQGAAGVLADMEPKLLGETTRRERPDVVAHLRDIAMRNSNASIAGMVRALMSRKDSTPLLAGIRVPTLIVVGEEDTITPPALSQQMHAAIGGSTLEVIPRVGHLPNLEDPSAFNRVLTHFLAHRV